MRTLFWVMLLVNVIFFAVMRWGGLLADESQVVVQPALHEEKIRLLDAPASAPEPAYSGTKPTSATLSAASVLAASAPLATKTNALVCLEWGDFSGADLMRATAALSALQLGNKLGQRQIEHNIGYWVYIPPLKDMAVTNQKLAQLKARGIEEYFVVQEPGQWLNAISLGVFKTREAAQKFVDALRAKDVRSAQIGERVSKLKATIFVLQGIDSAVSSKLTALQQDYAGSVINNISCAGMK